MRAKWTCDFIDVPIPGYGVEVYQHPDRRVRVELEPTNGYDDGQLHRDTLRFFVSVYRQTTYDADHDEWIDSVREWSRYADDETTARCLLMEGAAVAEKIANGLPLTDEDGRPRSHA
jgi:hypothetical protein